MNPPSRAWNTIRGRQAYAAAVAGLGAWRRLTAPAALLALAVTGVAAVASPGALRPADPAWWVAGLLIAVSAALLVRASATLLWRHRPATARAQRPPHAGWGAWRPVLLALVAAAAVVVGLLELGNGPTPNPTVPPPLHHQVPPVAPAVHQVSGPGLAIGPWLALIGGLALLGFLVWAAAHRIRQRLAVAPAELLPGDALAAAITAALVDLEGESDPRRAVIKAYARTEAVLRDHGLPRDPAEAPLEYLDRVLRDLGGRAAAVDRLTVLFERAAFSRHDVGPEMRDEAVAAFHGLRVDLSADR